jgi:spermidine/putrescine transport system substrate-binding protein
MSYHGYNTGLLGLEEQARAQKMPLPELIFFDDQQLATMSPYTVTDSLQRRVDILQKAKARSAH